MKFNLYTQLINGEVYKLRLKPINQCFIARDAVLSAKTAVAEIGERALMDCIIKTTRKTYRASLGQTSIWYERVKS